MKRGDIVPLRFSPKSIWDFEIISIGKSTVRGRWASGSLKTRESTIDKPIFHHMRKGAEGDD